MLFKAKIICLAFSLFGGFVQADFRGANEASRQRGWLPLYEQAKGLVIQNQNEITLVWPEDSSESLESLILRFEFVVDPSELMVMGEGDCSGGNEGAGSDNDFLIECHFSGEGEKGVRIETSQRLNPKSSYQFHNGRIQPVDIFQGKRAITDAWQEAEFAKRAEAGVYQQLNQKVERPFLLAPDHHLTLAMQSVLFRTDTWQPDQHFENNLVAFPVIEVNGSSGESLSGSSVAASQEYPPTALFGDHTFFGDHTYSSASSVLTHPINESALTDFCEHDYCHPSVDFSPGGQGGNRSVTPSSETESDGNEPLNSVLYDNCSNDGSNVLVDSQLEEVPCEQREAGLEHGIIDPYEELSNLDWLCFENLVVNAVDKPMSAAEGIVALRNHCDAVEALMEVQDQALSAAVLLDFKKKAPFDKDMKDAAEALLKLRKQKE